MVRVRVAINLVIGDDDVRRYSRTRRTSSGGTIQGMVPKLPEGSGGMGSPSGRPESKNNPAALNTHIPRQSPSQRGASGRSRRAWRALIDLPFRMSPRFAGHRRHHSGHHGPYAEAVPATPSSGWVHREDTQTGAVLLQRGLRSPREEGESAGLPSAVQWLRPRWSPLGDAPGGR